MCFIIKDKSASFKKARQSFKAFCSSANFNKKFFFINVVKTAPSICIQFEEPDDAFSNDLT